MKFRVLIASSASFIDSSAEVPFLYKRAGCEVHVFCHASSWLLSNRFYDKWIDSGPDDEDIFKAKLIELIKADLNYYDKIVMTDDATIKLMNDEIGEDDPQLFSKILPLTKMENRVMLSSKAGLSKVLDKYGIATPKFETYSDQTDLEAIKTSFAFPILLKVDYSFSGIGLTPVTGPEGLDAALEKITDKKRSGDSGIY